LNNSSIVSKVLTENKILEQFPLIKKENQKWLYTENHTPSDVDVDNNFDYISNYNFRINQEELVRNIENKNDEIRSLEVIDEDNRILITKTNLWPHSVCCKLSIEFPYHEYRIGSGILIGKRHVLTAGHNIFEVLGDNYPEWAKSINVDPALNGLNNKPFNRTCNAIKCYTFSNWKDSQDPNYDIGIIILDYDIGLETGYTGIASTNNTDILKDIVYISGYPYNLERNLDGNHMLSHADKIQHVARNTFQYNIDTDRGQSGSGIVLMCNDLNSLKVIGVHSKTNYSENYGVRITNEKFDQLFNILNQT